MSSKYMNFLLNVFRIKGLGTNSYNVKAMVRPLERTVRRENTITVWRQCQAFILGLLLSGFASADAIRLHWSIPTENADGSELTDLAGFKIYQGFTAGGPYDLLEDVTNPTWSTYRIDIDQGRTYHFVMTAYDEDGNESEYSNEVAKLILDTMPPTKITITITVE